ncbi:alpha/beta hydrolase, partial [Pseudomonas sp. 2822-17]|uniref:alpha/beta hydrolase n=1 Tax=Pseudomonas sp. 2822-17 TaxID=1712678 RepID=UPI0015ABDE3B
SNGANIAGSLLYHYENSLKGAVLLHPMVPRRGIQLPELSGTPVFIGAGKNDPICPAQETIDLEKDLSGAGAQVEVFWS